MTRRHVDVAAAVVGLVLLSPLMLLIAAVIRCEDGGPALFTQTRVGRHKRPFRICKFRTMRAERVTRVGRWLRQTGLDELPQLLNMLRGDMTLIGPRPLTDADVCRLGWDDDAHAGRWSVRPGVVGLAQLYAGRGARQSWFLDAAYVSARGWRLDAGIVAMSAAVSVVGKRRVRRWLRVRRRQAAARERLAARAAAARAAAGTRRPPRPGALGGFGVGEVKP